MAADGGEIGRVRGEPGEEIELDDRGGEEVDRVEAVAVAVDGRGIGGGREGEVDGEHDGKLQDPSPKLQRNFRTETSNGLESEAEFGV